MTSCRVLAFASLRDTVSLFGVDRLKASSIFGSKSKFVSIGGMSQEVF